MSLFMSVEKTRPGLFGCCQLAHISHSSATRKGRTEAFTVQFLTLRTLLQDYKQVTAWLGAAGAYMDRADPE